jgi:hypothetical protein
MWFLGSRATWFREDLLGAYCGPHLFLVGLSLGMKYVFTDWQPEPRLLLLQIRRYGKRNKDRAILAQAQHPEEVPRMSDGRQNYNRHKEAFDLRDHTRHTLRRMLVLALLIPQGSF